MPECGRVGRPPDGAHAQASPDNGGCSQAFVSPFPLSQKEMETVTAGFQFQNGLAIVWDGRSSPGSIAGWHCPNYLRLRPSDARWTGDAMPRKGYDIFSRLWIPLPPVVKSSLTLWKGTFLAVAPPAQHRPRLNPMIAGTFPITVPQPPTSSRHYPSHASFHP